MLSFHPRCKSKKQQVQPAEILQRTLRKLTLVFDKVTIIPLFPRDLRRQLLDKFF